MIDAIQLLGMVGWMQDVLTRMILLCKAAVEVGPLFSGPILVVSCNLEFSI